MAVGGMHIRHDFNTWVDWEQVSVRTCCGSTTKRHLAGIPGITAQPSVIETKDKHVWGWCMRCVNAAWSSITNNATDKTLDERVQSLYQDAERAIMQQYLYERGLQEQRRQERLAKQQAQIQNLDTFIARK